MKILVISPFRIFPTYSGFATRAYNITKQLSSNFEVVLFYVDFDKKYFDSDQNYLPKVAKKKFKATKRWMQFLNPSLVFCGIKSINREKVDLILAESIWAGFHAMILRAITKTPYCLTEQNVEYIRWKRMGMKYSSLLRIFEKYCCKFSKKVFCMSDDDQRQINKLGIDLNNITVVPNGVDILQFRPTPSKKHEIAKKLNISVESPIILFSGSLDYTPNLQAVQIIYEKLVDSILEAVPEVKFVIVGSNPPLQFKHKAIIYTGFVDRIENYINASDLVIAPLISGGGTKLKIVEAVACGKIVITTSIGAEGLIDETTDGFLIVADDWNDFILKTINVLKSSPSSDSSQKFIEKYSWDFIGNKLCKEISAL